MDPRLARAIRETLGNPRANTTSVVVDTSAFGLAAEKASYEKAAKGAAGTGRPIPDIHGVAKDRATRARVGGGPKANGGGGIARGDRILRQRGQRAELGAGAVAGVIADLLTTTLSIGFRYGELVLEDRRARRAARVEGPAA